jgi:hypothetical protein
MVHRSTYEFLLAIPKPLDIGGGYFRNYCYDFLLVSSLNLKKPNRSVLV